MTVDPGQIVLFIILAIVIIFVLVILGRAIRIIPQATAGVVERLGKYHKTLLPGLNIVIPLIDRVRPLIDMREQVVSFPPQPVITEDNLVVSIDTVVYFQVTDARAATYEIANYLGAVEQLTTTTLRNVVGGLNLEEALTSRDNINGQLRIVLDEATGKWGIRVGRVELKAIDPPVSIQDSMEKQMRAERDRRAVILTAEGTKQSAILTAEGARQAAILEAEGYAKAAVLRAEGEGQGHHHRLPGHPRRRPRPPAARLPIPSDAAQDRRKRLEQAVDHPERTHPGAAGIGHGVHRPCHAQSRIAQPEGQETPGSAHAGFFSPTAFPGRARILAHRGFAVAAPENTLLAFEHAVQLGVDYLETDVHASADGEAMLSHDPGLLRLTGRDIPLRQLTAAQLRGVDLGQGQGYASLADALHAFPQARFNIDVKSADAIAGTVRAVREAKAEDRVLVTSFSDARRLAVTRQLPGVGHLGLGPHLRAGHCRRLRRRRTGPAPCSEEYRRRADPRDQKRCTLRHV